MTTTHLRSVSWILLSLAPCPKSWIIALKCSSDFLSIRLDCEFCWTWWDLTAVVVNRVVFLLPRYRMSRKIVPVFFLQSSVWKRSSDSVSLSCCPAHCSCCIWAKKWWFDWLKFDRLSFCSPCKVYVLCPFLFFAFLLYNSTQTNCSVSIAVMHLCCCRNFVDSLLRVIIIIVYILACLRQCSYS